MQFYSFDDIFKACSCIEIAESMYGVTVNNSRCAALWRGGENAASVAIEHDKWFDHGRGKGGSVIDLAAIKFDGNIQIAQNYLGEKYNLEPKMKLVKQPASSRHDKLLSEGWTETHRYNYIDIDGKTKHYESRYDHPDKGKTYAQGTPSGSGMKGIKPILYNLTAVIASDIIYITEGPKCADILIERDLTATTCCCGAGGWRSAYNHHLQGKTVIMLCDQDEPGYNHGQDIARNLWGIAKQIQIITPSSNGGDIFDYLTSEGGTIKSLQAMIDATEPITKKPDAREKTSQDNGKKGGRPESPLHADTADRFAASQKDASGLLTLIYFRSEWHIFKDSKWQTITDGLIKTEVAAYMRDHDELRKYATTNYIATVLLHLKTSELCGRRGTEYPVWLDTNEPAEHWVAFNNGIVVNLWAYAEALSKNVEPDPLIYSRQLSPAFFSSDFVDYPWQPDIIPHKFFAYVDKVLPEMDDQILLQAMYGLSVAPISKYEVFFQLIGNGANGKSVALNIDRALVGTQNTSYVPLLGLIERFQQWPLAQSKINICGDLATDNNRGQFHQIEGALKDCISGGSIEYEKKGKDKFFAKCRALFIMAANTLPTFIDKSDAIWRRLRIIPFAVQIPEAERDPDLASKIIDNELSGVMIWALGGLSEVMEQGRVVDSEAGKRVKHNHRLSCDHEKMFLDENYVVGDDEDRIKSVDLYNQYRAWISANGYRALGASKFYTRVEDILAGAMYGTMRIDLCLVKGFKNIAPKRGENGNVTDVTAIGDYY